MVIRWRKESARTILFSCSSMLAYLHLHAHDFLICVDDLIAHLHEELQ